MKVFAGKNWQNWSGSVSCTPKKIFFPTTEQDIVNAIHQSAYEKQKLRAVGSGHSFTPLIETEDNIISLKQYHGLYSIDSGKCEAIVKAGTELRPLGQLLAQNNLAMENLGDIDCQTISGAIATGTHGTGATLGNISTQVIGFTLITASGEILECSETQNPEIFRAGQVSLGALGIISKVKLRLNPLYSLKVEKKKKTLEESLDNFLEDIKLNRHYEFFWLPHSEHTYTKTMNIVESDKKGGLWRKYLGEIFFENGALFVLGNLCRLFPQQSNKISKWGASLIPEGEEVNISCNIFSSYRLIKFHEMEYALPLDKGVDVLRTVQKWIETNNIKVSFPIEFRVAKEDNIYLSPACGRPTIYIAIHSFRGTPYQEYFAGCEKIFLEAGGRPHWGKMHSLTSKELKNLYPEWATFQKIRKQLDPQGLFLNKYLQTIFEEN